tara:strand:- start:181 stop:297 length:117 start_codon:yes stop_codon:yes gene_type:complete
MKLQYSGTKTELVAETVGGLFCIAMMTGIFILIWAIKG